MKHILSKAWIGVLAQMSWSNLLVGLDFDGTLAPIVADRDKAHLRPQTKNLLRRVCARYPTVVISGRAKSDVSRRVEGLGVLEVVGNHGAEPGPNMRRFARETELIFPLLEERLEKIPGVEIENKTLSLAIHFRKSREKIFARDSILQAIAELPTVMRTVSGKCVINVVSRLAYDKGEALVRLRETYQADTALYVGDDVTDEDVFSLDEPGRLLSIRVGLSRSSSACFYLRTQGEIDELFRALLAFPKGRTHGRTLSPVSAGPGSRLS